MDEKFKFGGIEMKISSEEECAAEDVVRVAMTKDQHDRRLRLPDTYEIPGTKGGFFCNICNTEIVLAPSGQRIEALGGKFTCMNCVMKMMKASV